MANPSKLNKQKKFEYYKLSKQARCLTTKQACIIILKNICKLLYGRTSFGRQVDLPLDSISAVGTNAFNSIAISTSSSKISFMAIKNRDEIHKVLSNLLIERQGKPAATSIIKQEIPQSNADELKKYKDLLDSGAITQEEFDAKKKELLGL